MVNMNHSSHYAHVLSRIISLLVIASVCSQLMIIVPVQAGQFQKQSDIAVNSASISGCPMFPANNIWNTPVNDLPVHARSAQWIDAIGRYIGFHMDFGSGTWDGGPIGIPYNVVSGGVTVVPGTAVPDSGVGAWALALCAAAALRLRANRGCST